MPQPQDSDLDPLLEFFEEHAKPPEPAEPAEPAKDVAAEDARVRVDRLERQVERALIDITTLKSDLATLVSAVEEIKRRTSRVEKPAPNVVAMPSQRVPRARTVATALVVIVLSAAAWNLMSAVSYGLPELPPIESESPAIMALPLTVEARPPYAIVAARTTPTSPPAPPAVRFVGTLTIDAEPAGNVFLNRQSVGRTPLRLDNLRAGSHLVWIEREGYRRWTRSVAVAADRISRVSASLDPLSR